MMGTLYVYNNFTPNDTGTHYYGDDTAFNNLLATHQLTTVNMDNYRINNNQVLIAFNSQITQSNYHSVTYLRDTTDNAYYFVDNRYLQGGYIVYTVHKDLWAMYINKASINKIIVNRCNRNIGVGVYDDIDVYGDRVISTYYSSSSLSLSDVSLVCCIQYDPNASTLKNEKIATICIAVSAEDILREMRTAAAASQLDLFTCLQLFGAGIKEVSIKYLTVYEGARLTKAFLIPDYLLTKTNITGKLTALSPSDTEIDIEGYVVSASITSINYNVTTYTNYKYYIGTKIAGMPLPRLTKNNDTSTATTGLIATSVQCIVETNDIKIFMRCGNVDYDISQQFTVPTALTDHTAESINDLRRFFVNAGTIAGGIISKNYTVVGAGVAGFANDAFDRSARDNSGQIQAGVANVIYEARVSGSTYTLSQPFKVYRYTAVDNRIQQAIRLRGATFNKNVASFNDIFTFDLLGSAGVTDDTYVVADCSIDNVPTDARELIRNKLSRGVYIQPLSR